MIGLALFKWDDLLGVVLDVKYPGSFEISDNLANKVLMAHSISESVKNEDFIEVEMDEQLILSYWKNLETERGYELMIFLLDTGDIVRLQHYKQQFLDFSKDVLSNPEGTDRQEYFLKTVQKFFIEGKKRKILLMGRAEVGKTSIKQVIFEGKDPKDLLTYPLAPTKRLLTPSVHSWLDLELGVFDTSGQELERILDSDKSQIMAMGNTDIIIYLLDNILWTEEREKIITDIKRIAEINEQQEYGAKIVLFFHKIDLFDEEDRKNKFDLIRKQIELPIYFTSLYPELIYTVYNAFYKLLSGFTEETIMLKEILDEKMESDSKTMFFITNVNNNIIVQTMTPDFNYKIINYIHNLIAQLNLTLENMRAEDKIDHLILQTKKNFNVIMKFLDLMDYNLKNLICISETLNPNKLIWISGEISRILNKKLKFR